MKILTNRLISLTDSQIPENQHGFRKGRSTLQAVNYLINQAQDTLRDTGKKYFVVFVDYSKAFDLINRDTLIQKLNHMIGDNHPLTIILSNILMYNHIQISDGTATSKRITQIYGVLQGDSISPIMFNIMTADITEITRHSSASFILYADDMAIGSENKEELQVVLNRLDAWAERNDLNINHSKTKQMTFRKGGKHTSRNTMALHNKPLEVVPKFKYLGVNLQTTLSSFNFHVTERATAAINAIYNIQQPQQISLATAITLFRRAIARDQHHLGQTDNHQPINN